MIMFWFHNIYHFFKKSCLHLKISWHQNRIEFASAVTKKSWAGWPGLLALAIAFLAAGKLRFNPLSWSAGARRAPIVWGTPLDQSRGCALTPGPRYRHAPPVHPVTSLSALCTIAKWISAELQKFWSRLWRSSSSISMRCVRHAAAALAHSAVNEHVTGRENYCGRIP